MIERQTVTKMGRLAMRVEGQALAIADIDRDRCPGRKQGYPMSGLPI
jgi:hypothetical protein